MKLLLVKVARHHQEKNLPKMKVEEMSLAEKINHLSTSDLIFHEAWNDYKYMTNQVGNLVNGDTNRFIPLIASVRLKLILQSNKTLFSAKKLKHTSITTFI